MKEIPNLKVYELPEEQKKLWELTWGKDEPLSSLVFRTLLAFQEQREKMQSRLKCCPKGTKEISHIFQGSCPHCGYCLCCGNTQSNPSSYKET